MRKLKTNEYIAVAVGVTLAGFVFISSGVVQQYFGLSGRSANVNSEIPMAQDENTAGLLVQDTITGTGSEAVPGKIVTVNYVGTLKDGTKFDSSIDRGVPFEFTLGDGQVIEGWERGFVGMKVGGKRLLIIPPELAYGNRQIGPIPPNSTLVFTVDLLGVRDVQ